MNSTNSKNGENLIFMISQPRAGSTLTQRILGSHPDIHTVSEPWLMLHPLYALRSEGYNAEYNAKLAQVAVKDFLQLIPDGENAYFESLRRTYSYLYECVLNSSGKHYFLDKTPRYYHIIPELVKVFPNAKFIFLLRNPLAVLASIISTWTRTEWFKMYYHYYDLIKAPNLILEGIKKLEEKCIVLHYEELLTNPGSNIKAVCDRLSIEFYPEIIDYGKTDYSSWKLGDTKKVDKHTRPDSNNLDNWIKDLKDPQAWRAINDYLHWLGQDTLIEMGYSYEELQQILDINRPKRLNLSGTVPLAWLLKQPEDRKSWNYEYALIRLVRSLQLRGFGGTGVRVVQKLVGISPNYPPTSRAL